MTVDPWEKAISDLAIWHTYRSATAARASIAFIESELRLSVPPLVRRTWPAEDVDDALREFLTRLLERPLPSEIDDPKRYVVRAFRNRCIDLHRAQQRHREAVEGQAFEWTAESAVEGRVASRLEEQQRADAVQIAVHQLPPADRIALKLVDAPEWLDATEIEWLANRLGIGASDVRGRLSAADGIHSLTEIFDPPVPGEQDDRRLRMERFRRRRARAREKLRAILDANGTDS